MEYRVYTYAPRDAPDTPRRRRRRVKRRRGISIVSRLIVSQYETRFDAYNCDLYYNIDLDSGGIITLKDWFGPDYRRIVSESIETTIAGWSDEQRGILWEDLSVIDLISEDTNFYFNQDGQIVIVIEKYEAAYGAAGNLEFTIQSTES